MWYIWKANGVLISHENGSFFLQLKSFQNLLLFVRKSEVSVMFIIMAPQSSMHHALLGSDTSVPPDNHCSNPYGPTQQFNKGLQIDEMN